MDICVTFGILLFVFGATSVSPCYKQLSYYEGYGYGTNITCDHLNTTERHLMDLSSYHPAYLQIKNSNLTDFKPDVFNDIETLKIFEIINSRISFNSTIDIFKNLKSLKKLIIHHSVLTGITDKIFISLEHLTFMRLSNLNIKSLPKNSLKPLKSLVILDLSNNTITDLHDIPLCEVPHLKTIILEGNNIVSLETTRFICTKQEDSLNINLNEYKYEVGLNHPSLYEERTKTSNLIELNLSHNGIISLSYCFDGLENLQFLNLDYNNIDALHGYEFKPLKSLQTMSIRYNLLSNMSEILFNTNNALRNIIIANNNLRYLIVKNKPVLKYVDLSRNTLNIDILSEWRNVPMLNKLDLSFNKIKILNKNVFQNFNNLTSLDLTGNTVILENDTFEFLPKLSILKLGHNRISQLPEGIFKNLSKLELLDLSDNALMDIKNAQIFEGLIYLKALNLSNNELRSINSEMLGYLKNLEVLDVEGNKLKLIDLDQLSSLRYLINFNFRNNKFSCEFLTNLLHYLKKKEIDYSHEKYANSVPRENVGGIPCTEDAKIPIVVLNETSVSENHTQISKFVNPESSRSHKTSTSIFTIAEVSISLLLVLSIFGFLSYKYYRRRKLTNEHFELIGE